MAQELGGRDDGLGAPATTGEGASAVAERLGAAHERLSAAERASGRPVGSVRLLLATKTVPAGLVRAALQHSAVLDGRPLLLGENRVQELVDKGPALADLAPEVHLIGHLQSNKVNAALRWAACVQTLDSPALASRLAARAAATGRPLEVMVQVNVSGEATKYGTDPGAAVGLALHVAALEHLRLRGLMTVGARSDDPAVVRAGYARLRSLRDAVLASGAPGTSSATELSMGMSGDLEDAVAEGATLVRVGTAVFGARAPAPAGDA
jgi:hypothetical protein